MTDDVMILRKIPLDVRLGKGVKIHDFMNLYGRHRGDSTNSSILCATRLSENTIVGASSAVTKDVPSETVVPGGPAEILRRPRLRGPLARHGIVPGADETHGG
jgi:carbonic anhydrase/acetyltransferase-like protein (isoleucine patch superfamily)